MVIIIIMMFIIIIINIDINIDINFDSNNRCGSALWAPPKAEPAVVIQTLRAFRRPDGRGQWYLRCTRKITTAKTNPRI